MTNAATLERDTGDGTIDHAANDKLIAEAEAMGFVVLDGRTGPTPAQIDDVIAGYDMAKANTKEAADDEKDARAQLQSLIRSFGHPAAGSEHSWDIQGALHEALLTEVTRTTLIESAIDTLHTFLNENNLPQMFARLFATRIKHELVKGAQDVLRTADMPEWKRTKLQALFALCLQVDDIAPRITVELRAKEPKGKRTRKKQAVLA